MTVEIKGLDKLHKSMSAISKQLPFAIMNTLNDLAFDGMDSMKSEVKGKLKLKNQKIPNAFHIKKATKKTLQVKLSIDDWKWQADVLKPHFYGGDRKRKGMEKAMIYAGAMSRDNILTPPPGVKIQSSTYVQMMSYLKLNYKAGYDANRNDKSKRKNKTRAKYFIATRKSNKTRHLHPGIYARMDDGVKDKPISLLRVARRPNYKKIFDLEKTFMKVIKRRGSKYFYKNLEQAMATAR